MTERAIEQYALVRCPRIVIKGAALKNIGWCAGYISTDGTVMPKCPDFEGEDGAYVYCGYQSSTLKASNEH
jgi:hypothetical protein